MAVNKDEEVRKSLVGSREVARPSPPSPTQPAPLAAVCPERVSEPVRTPAAPGPLVLTFCTPWSSECALAARVPNTQQVLGFPPEPDTKLCPEPAPLVSALLPHIHGLRPQNAGLARLQRSAVRAAGTDALGAPTGLNPES